MGDCQLPARDPEHGFMLAVNDVGNHHSATNLAHVGVDPPISHHKYILGRYEYTLH